MSLDDAISMEPVKEKLRNLSQYMPNCPEALYQYGNFLADQLTDEVFPMGFHMQAKLALCDLQFGIDSRGEPVPVALYDCHPTVYDNLEMSIPLIAEAVCPPAFAQDVKDVYHLIQLRLQENNS